MLLLTSHRSEHGATVLSHPTTGIYCFLARLDGFAYTEPLGFRTSTLVPVCLFRSCPILAPGGFVYRGEMFADLLEGAYVFADNINRFA